jgi:class 3 adenylate cyclase/tetratricopeptide (TPR) repeat protein
MKCPKCQFENREGAKFCKKCGIAFEAKCPSCGHSYGPESVYCDECGHTLVGAKAPSPVDYSKPLSYTPKHLADKILSARPSMQGERKQVTVLFADAANYTSMSEKLDPEEVRQIMDGCFEILLDEIHRYEGTVTQFTGDGAMALFGAPVAHEDHGQRACYAAIAIQRALEGYGDRVRKECGVDFKMRVGLNSGPVIVGSVGNDLKMEYTAVGDTVNLASRMESAAKPGAVLVSENTYRMVRNFFEFQPLGKLRVKGKEAPVEAYELVKVGEAATRFEAAVARGLTRFVGREKEMASLKEAFEKARAGSGQVVGIVGEAGVGKSRILLEARGMLPTGEYTYLEGRCLHYGGSMAYLPFLDVLRVYFNIEEGDREFIIKKKMSQKVSQLDEKLKDILPPLQDILSLKVEDEDYLKLDPPLKRVKIFESIRDLLIRESQNRPLVLAIEDLHWIDRTSEEFLDYLIGFLPHTRILLLLLYRPEYTHQWGSKSYYSQIGVDQLSLASSAELVRAILEGGEVAPELRELILTRTAGNPLFMEEFTHALVENGSIKKRNHQYVLGRKPSEIQVPDTIQGIIAARMDRLEENLKRTMQVASVIGRDFAYRILQTITGMREELKSYLINLQGLEFIYEKSLFPELEYIFKHALTQEVAYNSLLVKRRKEIHDRIGKAIEELYQDRLEEFYEMLAHHFSKSENLEKAYQYLRLSSVKTGLRSALWESIRLGSEAIDVLKRMPDTDENKRRSVEMRLLLSGPMSGQGFPGDSLKMMEEGARLAEELDDNRSLANLWGTISMYHSQKGDLHRAYEFAAKAFQAAELTGDVELVATNGFELCLACTVRGEFTRVSEVAPRVLQVLEEAQMQKRWDLGKYYNLNLYSAILSYYGVSLGYLGDFERGQAFCENACRFAEEVGNMHTLSAVEYAYSILACLRGDAKRALEHAQKAIKYSEQTEMVILLWIAPTQLGHVYYLLGELETARQHFEKRLEIYRSTEYPMALSWNYYGLGMVCLDSSDLQSARSNINESLKLSQRYGEKVQEGLSTVALGRVTSKADLSQSARAEEYILQGIKMLEELKCKPYQAQGYLSLGELYADLGQKQKALESLNKAEAMYREMGMDYWLRRAQEDMAKLRG